MTVNTAKSKAVIGFGGGKRFELGGFVIEPGATRQDGWSAITATEAQPRRWLITATGYVENTDMQWKNPEHSSVGRNWGKAPSLVEGIRLASPCRCPRSKSKPGRSTNAASEKPSSRSSRTTGGQRRPGDRPAVQNAFGTK